MHLINEKNIDELAISQKIAMNGPIDNRPIFFILRK